MSDPLISYPGSLYLYSSKVTEVIDADTIKADINLGFNLVYSRKIRFYGVNAPELSTEKGIEAAEYVSDKLKPGTEFMLVSIKDRSGSFGRILGIIYLLEDGVPVKDSLNLTLINRGYAEWYRVSKAAKATMFSR